MGIKVPLLVIDRRFVSVMSTLFSNRRVRTLKVTMTIIMSFMHFDVPKFVRSPGCDHGHDEESQNGRDIKIDILDDYIRTPEVFRMSFKHLPEYRGVTGTPRGVNGPTWAKRKKREGSRRGPRTPPPPSPNRTREGGRRAATYGQPLSPFH